VVGGDSLAAEAAIRLARQPQVSTVTLLHRRNQWNVDPHTFDTLQNLEAEGKLQRMTGQIHSCTSTTDRLTSVSIQTPEGELRELPTQTVLVYLGLNPRLGPLAEWGLALNRKQLVVDPAQCSTTLPGVFAMGDVVTYPGKKKLLVTGFQECVQAAFAAAEYLCPQDPPGLEYTSSSSRLQKRLGVA
jgi:thioredoxin reductase (NADPH)